MKIRSIRLRLAIATGVLSAIIVLFFAAVSAVWFYQEQLDAAHEEPGSTLTPQQIADAQGDVKELVTAYLIALPLAAIAVASGAWWMAGRLTKPLAQLAAATRSMDARTLHKRLPKPVGDDEITSLTHVLNSLFERLEKSFSQASRFAADASHELRTPLAVMRARTEIAIQSNPSAPHAAVLVELLEDNQRLATITEKLLLLARADAGRLMSESQTVNLSGTIAAIVEDFRPIATERRLHFESEIAPDVSISGDAALLRQLFFNLFDNATKYNTCDGKITIRLTALAHEVSFRIVNAGVPIPPEVQSRLFERFFRANESRGRELGGAGLGLSLCREIASAHGGRLELISSDAAGTIFQVTLPRS